MPINNSILENQARKIKKQRRHIQRLRAKQQEFWKKEEQLKKNFPDPPQYWIMGLGCLAVLIFDIFVSRITVAWLANMLNSPPIVLAIAYALLDAVAAALASGKTKPDPVESRHIQKNWQKILWSLAAIKITLFVIYVLIVHRDEQIPWVFQLLEILFQAAMVGVIYFVLHHAGAGVLYIAQKFGLWIQKVLAGSPDRAQWKLFQLCTTFWEEVHKMQLPVEDVCSPDAFEEICQICKTSHGETRSTETESREVVQPDSPPTTAVKYPRSVTTQVRKVLKSARQLEEAKRSQALIASEEATLKNRFAPPGHYFFLAVVTLICLAIDFLITQQLLGWLGMMIQISPQVLALLITLLDGAIAAMASGETAVDQWEAHELRRRWRKILWGMAAIKIFLFWIFIFVYQGSYQQQLHIALFAEVFIFSGVTLIIYVGLLWAGGGLVWLTSRLRLWLWHLIAGSPEHYQEQLHRHCDRLRALLQELNIDPKKICRDYNIQCTFCQSKR